MIGPRFPQKLRRAGNSALATPLTLTLTVEYPSRIHSPLDGIPELVHVIVAQAPVVHALDSSVHQAVEAVLLDENIVSLPTFRGRVIGVFISMGGKVPMS